MKNYTLSLAFLSLFLMPAFASGQTQPNTSYRATVLNRGTTTLATIYTIPASEVQCNVPKVGSGPGTTINPNTVRWDDETNPTTLDCVWVQSGSNPIFSLPVGGQEYELILAATNPVGTSLDSTRSNPFSIPGSVPATLTNVRVTQ
jgi:hypothetical protein